MATIPISTYMYVAFRFLCFCNVFAYFMVANHKTVVIIPLKKEKSLVLRKISSSYVAIGATLN